MITLLRLRYLVVVNLLCPLGIHPPWPAEPFGKPECAYCGAPRKR